LSGFLSILQEARGPEDCELARNPLESSKSRLLAEIDYYALLYGCSERLRGASEAVVLGALPAPRRRPRRGPGALTTPYKVFAAGFSSILSELPGQPGRFLDGWVRSDRQRGDCFGDDHFAYSAFQGRVVLAKKAAVSRSLRSSFAIRGVGEERILSRMG